jgi:hypothetical protein
MMSTPIRNMSQAADSPPPEAGWSILLQNSSAHEAGQPLQHEPDIMDGPAFETGRSVVAQRSPGYFERGIIEEFMDLDKLGQGFTSVDPLEEIDIEDGKTPRPTFMNKTLETDPRNEIIGLLKNIMIALLGITLRCEDYAKR